jgi:hypothetical protein
MREQVTIDEVIAVLNEALKLDPYALQRLAGTRIRCNGELAHHPTIQVSDGLHGVFEVGLLGVINGMFGVDDQSWGPIAAYYDEGLLVRFERTHAPDPNSPGMNEEEEQ